MSQTSKDKKADESVPFDDYEISNELKKLLLSQYKVINYEGKRELEHMYKNGHLNYSYPWQIEHYGYPTHLQHDNVVRVTVRIDKPERLFKILAHKMLSASNQSMQEFIESRFHERMKQIMNNSEEFGKVMLGPMRRFGESNDDWLEGIEGYELKPDKGVE